MVRVVPVHSNRKHLRGRPPKAAILSLRITLELKQYLRREARLSGRSMSQEAELRLVATMGQRLVVNMPDVRLIPEEQHEEEENRPY